MPPASHIDQTRERSDTLISIWSGPLHRALLHDSLSLLSGLAMALEALESSGIQEAEDREALRLARRNTQALSTLLAAAARVTRFLQRHEHVARRALDVSSIVQLALRRLPAADAAAVHVSVPPDAGTVLADEALTAELLAAVLRILCICSRDSEGTSRVLVTAEPSTGDQVGISVGLTATTCSGSMASRLLTGTTVAATACNLAMTEQDGRFDPHASTGDGEQVVFWLRKADA